MDPCCEYLAMPHIRGQIRSEFENIFFPCLILGDIGIYYLNQYGSQLGLSLQTFSTVLSTKSIK